LQRKRFLDKITGFVGGKRKMSFLDRLLGKNRQNTSGRDGNEINEPAGFEKILTSQLAAYWLETG
jgi:hypothetical protein